MPPRRPRRRDSESTRRKLMDAGRKAFAQKGLEGANLNPDILAPSGVSTGSFYHQFEDKADLFITIVEEHSHGFRGRLSAVVGALADASFEDAVRECYRFILDVADHEGECLRIQHRERKCSDPRIRRFLRENFECWEEAIREALDGLTPILGPDIDTSLGAEMVIKLGLGCVDDYLDVPAAERAAEREKLLEGLVRFTLGGLPALTSKPDPKPAGP